MQDGGQGCRRFEGTINSIEGCVSGLQLFKTTRNTFRSLIYCFYFLELPIPEY